MRSSDIYVKNDLTVFSAVEFPGTIMHVSGSSKC